MTVVYLFILTYSIGSLDFSYNLNCKLQFFSYAHSLIRASKRFLLFTNVKILSYI